MFWEWLLKYSSFLITGIISFAVSYFVWFLTTKRTKLIYYLSHTQFVTIPANQQNQAVTLGTSTLFLQNLGDAPAKNVQIGHFNATPFPHHSVFPDIQRSIVDLPGGGTSLQFPVIPPKTIIFISYLLPPPAVNLDQLISYVMSEEGNAEQIPVILQRVFPGWVNKAILLLMLAGAWVAVNLLWTLTKFLWVTYYR